MKNEVIIYIESTENGAFQFITLSKIRAYKFLKSIKENCKTLKCTIINNSDI